MFIPVPLGDRWGKYEQVLDACFVSAEQRRTNYQRLRAFYLYGTDQGDEDETINKIYPLCNDVRSFLYASETTRFSTNIGAAVDKLFLDQVPILNRAVNDQWLESNADINFDLALEWALAYGTELIKPVWKDGEIEPFIVEPHDFGVLREDTPQISRQEAFAQRYWVSEGELETNLKAWQHPRASEIMSNISSQPKNSYGESNLLSNLLISSQMPAAGAGQAQGRYVNQLLTPKFYVPKVDEKLVKMTELYIYDSNLMDFRVITIANPYVVVFDRPISRTFVDREVPYVQVCPIPDKNYFWGRSQVERLIPLQRKRNQRVAQIFRMLDKQASPPTALSGFPGATDEMKLALDTPAGFVVNDNPAAKVDRLAPEIPEDMFAELREIDQDMTDEVGLTNVTQGKGEAGVRSTGHAAQLGRYGSSRIKKRALIIEDSLEKLATLYLQMLKKYDDKSVYKDTKGQDFAAHQFTDDFVVKVDAHSNSPIFVEDQMQKGLQLFKAQVIKPERLIEFMNMPMEQILLREYTNEIGPAMAANKEREMVLKEAEARGRTQGKG